MNLFALQAVSLLCGFLVAFPPVYSIRCYHKTVYNKQVINDEAVDCKEKGYDKCGTLTFNLDSSSYNVLIKNCTRSTLDCDEAVACERASAVYKKHGLTVMDCSSSCCDSDNCNAPGKKESEIC